MSEITVNLDELKMAIYRINQLEKGTGFFRPHTTSEIINHSRGELFKQTNALYKELMRIEDTMIDLIKNTKLALTNAGVDFASTDCQLSTFFGSLGAQEKMQNNQFVIHKPNKEG